MSFTIDSIEFNGPISQTGELENHPGLFVLLETIEDTTEVIDFGFMKDLAAELSITVRDTKLKKGILKVGFKYVESAEEAEPLVERLEAWFDTCDSCIIPIHEQEGNAMALKD